VYSCDGDNIQVVLVVTPFDGESKESLRLEVFAAVTMKNGAFSDVTPRGSCKNRRFGGTYRPDGGAKFFRNVRSYKSHTA
jgi:hypothetical protein